MVRYRKEMINHLDADAVRDVQIVYEELWWDYKQYIKEIEM